jgi:hypothetical protein
MVQDVLSVLADMPECSAVADLLLEGVKRISAKYDSEGFLR